MLGEKGEDMTRQGFGQDMEPDMNLTVDRRGHDET